MAKHHYFHLLTMNSKTLSMNSYDDYKEIFEATCCLLKTFNGSNGKAIVKEVNDILDHSPAMRQFLFDFYYNTRAVDNIK